MATVVLLELKMNGEPKLMFRADPTWTSVTTTDTAEAGTPCGAMAAAMAEALNGLLGARATAREVVTDGFAGGGGRGGVGGGGAGGLGGGGLGGGGRGNGGGGEGDGGFGGGLAAVEIEGEDTSTTPLTPGTTLATADDNVPVVLAVTVMIWAENEDATWAEAAATVKVTLIPVCRRRRPEAGVAAMLVTATNAGATPICDASTAMKLACAATKEVTVAVPARLTVAVTRMMEPAGGGFGGFE